MTHLLRKHGGKTGEELKAEWKVKLTNHNNRSRASVRVRRRHQSCRFLGYPKIETVRI